MAAEEGSPAAASRGEGSRDPHTPVGANGLPHSGPRLAVHVRRRTAAMAVAWPRSTAAKEGRGGAREDQERTAEPVTVDAGLPGARRWKNDGGQARARGGNNGGRKRARGERREEELGVERRVVLVLHYLVPKPSLFYMIWTTTFI